MRSSVCSSLLCIRESPSECFTAIWSVVVKQFECSIVTKILEGIAWRGTIRFLTLQCLIISKIQRSWRQFYDVTTIGSFQTGQETTICRRLQGPSQFPTPLDSQLILRIYTSMNGLGGGAKTEFAPGAGSHRYATAHSHKQRRSQRGGWRGSSPLLSHRNIDVYFFNFSPTLKSRWGALQNTLRQYHKA